MPGRASVDLGGDLMPMPPPVARTSLAPNPSRRVTPAELSQAQEEVRALAGPSTSTLVPLALAPEAAELVPALRPEPLLPVIPPPPQTAPGAPGMTDRPFSPRAETPGRMMSRPQNRWQTAARLLTAPSVTEPLVRSEPGSEALTSAEEQFRLSLQSRQPGKTNAAGLPLGRYEPPEPDSLPPVAADLGGTQKSQVEAAVVERTKQLNRLFEDQVKKQYEAMRREVTKLAKAHQKDVQGLDERFKQKIAGLSSRFKQLEEGEERVRTIEQENSDLQVEINRLYDAVSEHEVRNEAALRTISEREADIAALSAQLAEAKQQQVDTVRQAEERQAIMADASAALERTIDGLKGTIEKKKDDLRTMQGRLRTAKSSYDDEVFRKQEEVSELELQLRQLHTHTSKMYGFTEQVQAQIVARESDMKAQLGLMKNTVAFSLYIDETLQVDLTCPTLMNLLAAPVIVYPSGVTYSGAALERIHEDAAKRGQPPKCPQTGEVITHSVANRVVESILSRYLFKQQITKDVMVALADFQKKLPAGEEDQPLEAHLRKLKGVMADRLQQTHSEAMHQTKEGFKQQLEMKAMELASVLRAGEETRAELAELKDQYDSYKKASVVERTATKAELHALRDDLQTSKDELHVVQGRNADLINRTTRLAAEMTRIKEVEEDDAEGLG